MSLTRARPDFGRYIMKPYATNMVILYDGLYSVCFASIISLRDYHNLTNIVSKEIMYIYDYTNPDGLITTSDYLFMSTKVNDWNFEHYLVKIPTDPTTEESEILCKIDDSF